MRPSGCTRYERTYSLRWAVVGIVLLLAMFGHDALVIAEAQPGTATQLAVDSLDDRIAHVAHAASTSPASGLHLSHADTGCSVNASRAALQVRDSGMDSLPPTGTVPSLPVPPSPRASFPAEFIPDPSTRRARLQVYRI